MNNREHCKQIAETLEAYAEGRIYICPHCGEHITDNTLFCECGEQVDLISGDWEQASLYDYFNDILDIEYIVDCRKEYKSCRILVAFGGPNIYIDTQTGNIELYWWTDRASFRIKSGVVEQVDMWAEEYYNCL